MAYSQCASDLSLLKIQMAHQQTMDILNLTEQLIKTLIRQPEIQIPHYEPVHLANIKAIIIDEKTTLTLIANNFK